MEQNVLKAARAAIDEIDASLCELFKARMEQVTKIAAYKAENHLPILDESREAMLMEHNLARLSADDPLRPYYADFLRHNMALSRQYQAQCLSRYTRSADHGA